MASVTVGCSEAADPSAKIAMRYYRVACCQSPARLVSVIGDIAKAMTTDTGLNQPDMLRIAGSFRGLSGTGVVHHRA